MNLTRLSSIDSVAPVSTSLPVLITLEPDYLLLLHQTKPPIITPIDGSPTIDNQKIRVSCAGLITALLTSGALGDIPSSFSLRASQLMEFNTRS